MTGPSAADIERQKQDAINERMAQQAAVRQQQQFDAEIARQAEQARQVQAAQAAQAGIAQQAAAQQALKNFYASRAYQEEGAAVPAGLIDVATQVDTFSDPGMGAFRGGLETGTGAYGFDPNF